MMDLVAGRTRLLAAVVVLALGFAACSDGDDDLDAELESAPSSTTTTTETTTTTTESTTTTLSAQAQAEADVAQLVTDFWLTEIDSSKGELGLEYLTGLIALRSQEALETLNAEGQILRDQGQKRIEVLRSEVDLEAGMGEVKTCGGSASELVDAETLERIGNAADPDFLTTSVYFVEQTASGWKINDYFPSSNSDSPELCEIGG